MVYLGSTLVSNLLLFIFHKIPIGFSPLASHCKTVFSEINAVCVRFLISNCGGALKKVIFIKYCTYYLVIISGLEVVLSNFLNTAKDEQKKLEENEKSMVLRSTYFGI